MANNPYVNKVKYGNTTVIDLTGDDVTAADVKHGKKFHLPTGQQVTGTMGFSWETWLQSASISTSGYSSLSDVLADEIAVRKLMTIHNSVDYLTQFTPSDTSVITILNNDIAAKWITLRDYAEDKLEESYGSLMSSIGKYGYGEWALMPQVPTMTANDAPYGTAFASSEYGSSSQAFNAFVDSTQGFTTLDNDNVGAYVGYHFVTPVKVTSIRLLQHTERYMTKLKVQASNDNFTTIPFETPEINASESGGSNRKYTVYSFDNNNSYEYYRIICTEYSGAVSQRSNVVIINLQFYAWATKGNIPKMTSNTESYGEASASSSNSSKSPYMSFQADENTYYGNGTGWYGADNQSYYWIQYKFTNPVCIKRINLAYGVQSSNTYIQEQSNTKIQVSNTGNDDDWTTIDTVKLSWDNTLPSGKYGVRYFGDVDNNDYWLYFRVRYDGSASSASGKNKMQFSCIQVYGRELKVSVPKMTADDAPYGNSDGVYTGTYYPWKAFNDTSDYAWFSRANSDPYVEYDFGKKVNLKHIYVYGRNPISGGSITFSNVFKYYDSEDNQWKNITDGITVTLDAWNQSTGAGYYTLHLNCNVISNKFRLYSSGTDPNNSNIVSLYTYNIQFFCEDYSEYDWDSDNPRHYLYDHGVEFETIDLTGYSDGTNQIDNSKNYKDVDCFVIRCESGVKSAVAGTSNKIDLSNYSLGRSILKIFTAVNNMQPMRACPSKDVNNFIVSKSLAANLSELPYSFFIDISSVNEEEYIVGRTHGENTSGVRKDQKYGIVEWWLE